jgi:hypothetical protein
MRYLFDANAVIALLREPGEPLAQRARKCRPTDIGLPAIVVYADGPLYDAIARSTHKRPITAPAAAHMRPLS